jgi:hypothetical protein
MDIIYYVHKSVELLFQILGLVEVWTRRSMELSPVLSPVVVGVALDAIERSLIKITLPELHWQNLPILAE